MAKHADLEGTKLEEFQVDDAVQFVLYSLERLPETWEKFSHE